MKDRTISTLRRVAQCSFLLQEAKKMGLGPRPPKAAKKDYAQLKRDVTYLLDRMPGGNTEANRKKLLRAVNDIVKTITWPEE